MRAFEWVVKKIAMDYGCYGFSISFYKEKIKEAEAASCKGKEFIKKSY